MNAISTAQLEQFSPCLFTNAMVLLILPLVGSLHPLISPNLLLSISPAVTLYLRTLLSLTFLLHINLHNPSTILRLIAALITPLLFPFSGVFVVSEVFLLLRSLRLDSLLRSKLLPCGLGLWRW